MSKTIQELIQNYTSQGFTLIQARNLTAQQIILSKIEKSSFVDSILLKGGVVMYNLTKEQRRTTSDLDFDFVQYSISNKKDIELFVGILNKKIPEYKVAIDGSIKDLHQQDYHGKRVKLLIKDKSETLKFKLDIGVHTLLTIKQEMICFSFDQSENVFLLVNPPEQIIAEKLYSLAKIGAASVRFKDIDDMYYLITNKAVDIDIVRKCLDLLTLKPLKNILSVQDVIDKSIAVLENRLFIEGYLKSNQAWLNVDYDEIKRCIIDFIHKI